MEYNAEKRERNPKARDRIIVCVLAELLVFAVSSIVL